MLLDIAAIEARRNHAPARKKKHVERVPDQVYALGYSKDGVMKYFYVGISINPQQRREQHYRAIKLGVDMKDAYVQARHLINRGYEIEFDILDINGEFTEREWCDILSEDGHELCNVAGCVDNIRKRRKRKAAQINDVVIKNSIPHLAAELQRQSDEFRDRVNLLFKDILRK